MNTSMFRKTFLLFLLFQLVAVSLSVWFKSVGWYEVAFLTEVVPLAIISIVWPIHRKRKVSADRLRVVLSTSIAGTGGIVVSNFVVYMIWLYNRDRNLSSFWGKDFDALKIELLLQIAVFVIFHLLSYLVVSKKVLKMLQRD